MHIVRLSAGMRYYAFEIRLKQSWMYSEISEDYVSVCTITILLLLYIHGYGQMRWENRYIMYILRTLYGTY